MVTRSVLTFILAIISYLLDAQCPNNVISNGSFNSPEGQATIAPSWTTTYGSPDINDAIGPLNSSFGYSWTGIPLSSADGGTWQNLVDMESVVQKVNLETGHRYCLKFEYAIMGIYSPSYYFNLPMGINILFDSLLVYSTPYDYTLFTWENDCYQFTASSDTLSIMLSPSQLGSYMGIDGICLTEIASLPNDTDLCYGDSISLNVFESNSTYLWQDNSTDSTFFVSQQGVYWVNIQNQCFSFTDSIIVSFKSCNQDSFLLTSIPNVFTPNGDERNDTFNFKLGSELSNISFTVYNRWGLQIKKSEEPTYNNISWDGRTTSGESCNAGVYFYVLQFINAKGDLKKRTGTSRCSGNLLL